MTADIDNDAAEENNNENARFIFVICQYGAESACKLEVMTNHTNLKLSFSQPGFITFKVDADNPLPERFSLKSTLARTYGWSIGKCAGDESGALVDTVIQEPKLAEAARIHVWQRDVLLPGKSGFEPGVNALTQAIGEQIDAKTDRSDRVNQYANADDLVFDIVLVTPNQWWYGYHYATTAAGRWPGGAPTIDTNVEVYSRAYFKLKEALLWSGIRLQKGDVCAEIGSAPGGACQLMLEYGCDVIGIDSAEMEAEVLEHPNFTHIRRRGHEVKKRDFRPVNWLMADLNVDPQMTLDLVQEISNHEAANFKGVILTLKLTELSMVSKVPAMMKQMRELGFQVVKARQLAFNRREFCLVAVKNKITLRQTNKTRKPKRKVEKPAADGKPVEVASATDAPVSELQSPVASQAETQSQSQQAEE
jgi:23S rRNA (cytidine2498-2'-O)-methyltransferase